VLIDATIVRIVLVPATMRLLGERNWWLPGWLDRRLPHLDVEGGARLTGGDDEPGPSTSVDREPALTG
jgi:RND superfamily putative drug exporter